MAYPLPDYDVVISRDAPVKGSRLIMPQEAPWIYRKSFNDFLYLNARRVNVFLLGQNKFGFSSVIRTETTERLDEMWALNGNYVDQELGRLLLQPILGPLAGDMDRKEIDSLLYFNRIAIEIGNFVGAPIEEIFAREIANSKNIPTYRHKESATQIAQRLEDFIDRGFYEVVTVHGRDYISASEAIKPSSSIERYKEKPKKSPAVVISLR